MAAGDWYYQVWEHDGQSDRVGLLATYKVEYDAQKNVDMLNSKAKYYSRDGCPPFRCFFVQPVLEEHLRESVVERYRQHLSEDRERFLKGYSGSLMELAKLMVSYTLHGIENCPSETYWRLSDHGGWFKCCSFHIEPFGNVKSYALYSGIESVWLKMAVECGKRESICTVDKFDDETALKAWLRNTQVAVPACENTLIDLFCDRYRVQEEWLK